MLESFVRAKAGERVFLKSELKNIYSPSPDATPLVAKNPMDGMGITMGS